MDALLEAEGLVGVSIRTLEVTTAERIARFIAAFSPLLMMAGLLGLYIEFKTPGFGLPGILGLLALALFLLGPSHRRPGRPGRNGDLSGRPRTSSLIEIFVLPGFGFPGVLGIMLVMWSLLAAMMHRHARGQWCPVSPELHVPVFKLSLAVVLSGVAAAHAGQDSPQNLILRASGSEAGHPDQGRLQRGSHRPGQPGRRPGPDAVTALRPGGAMLLGDRRMDVVTRGEFVEAQAAVRIVEVHGNRVVVEQANPEGKA